MHFITRGPWWSYIAHLSKQICIFTVEVSAKFTALGFLYKFYSTNPPPPRSPPPPPHTHTHHTPVHGFLKHLDDLNWILKEGHQRKHFCQIILKLVQDFCINFIAPTPPLPPTPPPPPPTHTHHTPVHVFLTHLDDLNWILKEGHQRKHFCQIILKLVQWFKVFYIAIKPYPLTAMFFDESWQLEQTW